MTKNFSISQPDLRLPNYDLPEAVPINDFAFYQRSMYKPIVRWRHCFFL